jgi:hypothetical protein
MKFGTLRPIGKVLDHWQLLHEYEVTGSAITTYAITSPYNVLMISGEGVDASTSIIDETGKAVTAVGTAQIDTAQYKFGQSSILLDGNSDYLSLADSADWYFGSNDFTIDTWVKFNDLPSAGNYRILCNQGATVNLWYFGIYNNSGTLQLVFNAEVASVGTIQARKDTAFSTNVWYHLAVIRTGNTVRLFRDGVQVGTDTTATGEVPNVADTLNIGVYSGDASTYLNGWLDDIRISKGLARWTSAFTPPLKTTALINGDTDEEYRLVYSIVSGAVDNYPYFRLNNDAGANYGIQRLTGIAAAISAVRNVGDSNWSLLGDIDVGDVKLGEFIIYAKSGYVRTSLQNDADDISGTTVTKLSLHGNSWNNSTAPVAAMYFTGAASGLGVGTKFLLYRKVI